MSTINTGWLKGKNGEKFAPKTLSSQVITNEGINLESKIYSDMANLVDANSDKTIYGVKTFMDGIKIGNATMTYDSANNRIVINVQ